MAARLTVGFLSLVLLTGCATCNHKPSRSFDFALDRFSFENELRTAYSFDDDGLAHRTKVTPAPEFSLHCFPMVRAAREFFYHARFEPAQPPLDHQSYRQLVDSVMNRNSQCPSEENDRVVIPGFGSLADFSVAYPELLKEGCGGPWRSYVQRGNWRMIFPFARKQQVRTAESLTAKLKEGLLPIVHVVDFPKLKINHALLLYDVQQEDGGILFTGYDPNDFEQPIALRFEPSNQRFALSRSKYFVGGFVNIYEVYTGVLY